MKLNHVSSVKTPSINKASGVENQMIFKEVMRLIYDTFVDIYNDLTNLNIISAFEAINASEQSNIAKDTDVTVVLGTEINDVRGDFASNVFTAREKGLHQLNGKVDFSNVDTAATSYAIIISTTDRDYDLLVFETNETRLSLSLSVCAFLDVGDTATLKVHQVGGTGGNVDLTNGKQSFSGHFVTST